MLLLILSSLIAEGWLGILEKIAIFCVVVWAVWALIQWAGWTVPQPIWILLYALVTIVLIVWLFELVRMVI